MSNERTSTEARTPRAPADERFAAGVIAGYIHDISERHREDEQHSAEAAADPAYEPWFGIGT
jgi:hypothetical protein